MAEQTSEELLEMQKKNCIYCKLVSGEMPCRKVYEDDGFLAVLEIRPAANGHVILFPKDHIMMLPLLPQDKVVPLFTLAAKLSASIKDAMFSEKVTVFVASGVAAEQSPPPLMHCVLHIIPRDKGDDLSSLDLAQAPFAQSDTLALSQMLSQATKEVVKFMHRVDILNTNSQQFTQVQNAPVPQQPMQSISDTEHFNTQKVLSESSVDSQGDSQPQKLEFDNPNEALIAALQMYPDLRKLIIAQPDLVQDYVAKSPQLAKLFEGVNIRALSLILQKQESQSEPVERKKVASEMGEQELFSFIDGNEGLRTWMLQHPEELATRIGENPRLAKFFERVDVLDLAKRYRAYRQVKGDA